MEPQAESLELSNGRGMLKGEKGMRKLWSASCREGRGLGRWRVETFGGSGLGAQRVGVSRVFERVVCLAPRRKRARHDPDYEIFTKPWRRAAGRSGRAACRASRPPMPSGCAEP